MLNIALTQVGSGSIQAIGYQDGTLVVQFAGQRHHYHYRDVPPELYVEFAGAESKGKFFAARIRAQFAFEMVAPGQRAEVHYPMIAPDCWATSFGSAVHIGQDTHMNGMDAPAVLHSAEEAEALVTFLTGLIAKGWPTMSSRL